MMESLKVARRASRSKKIKLADPPYRLIVNDTGQETGDYSFAFGMRATGKDKQTGQPWERRPALFDAKGKPLVGKKIGAGSEIKVAFIMIPFYTFLIGAGVSLRLEAVQVIRLVPSEF